MAGLAAEAGGKGKHSRAGWFAEDLRREEMFGKSFGSRRAARNDELPRYLGGMRGIAFLGVWFRGVLGNVPEHLVACVWVLDLKLAR